MLFLLLWLHLLFASIHCKHLYPRIFTPPGSDHHATTTGVAQFPWNSSSLFPNATEQHLLGSSSPLTERMSSETSLHSSSSGSLYASVPPDSRGTSGATQLLQKGSTALPTAIAQSSVTVTSEAPSIANKGNSSQISGSGSLYHSVQFHSHLSTGAVHSSYNSPPLSPDAFTQHLPITSSRSTANATNGNTSKGTDSASLHAGTRPDPSLVTGAIQSPFNQSTSISNTSQAAIHLPSGNLTSLPNAITGAYRSPWKGSASPLTATKGPSHLLSNHSVLLPNPTAKTRHLPWNGSALLPNATGQHRSHRPSLTVEPHRGYSSQVSNSSVRLPSGGSENAKH